MPAVTLTLKLNVDIGTEPGEKDELVELPQPPIPITTTPKIEIPNNFVKDFRFRVDRKNPTDMGKVTHSKHAATFCRVPIVLTGSLADRFEFETVMTTVCGVETPARASIAGLKLQVSQEGSPEQANPNVAERSPGVTVS